MQCLPARLAADYHQGIVVYCGSSAPSRQELIEIVSQLVLNASTDGDMYERRARYRKDLKVWKSLLVPLTPVSFASAALGHPPFGGVSRQPSRTPRGETRSMRRPLLSTLSAI
jgi:hypothetical protein